MYRPRVIPVLLLNDNGLVKSSNFSNYRYIGDPINAVKLFNDLNSDEIVFLDIQATRNSRCISEKFVYEVGEEANMPFSVGGGINNLDAIQILLAAGAERVVIGSAAVLNPDFISDAAKRFGSSSISICMDVKYNFFGKLRLHYLNGKKVAKLSPLDFAKRMESCGAGEIILQSIDKDGTMSGYDLNVINNIAESVTIPIVALGGAGNINDMFDCFRTTNVNGLAAGSLFIYQGSRRGILINYPDNKTIISGFMNKDNND